MRGTANLENSGNDPRQDYARFLQDRVREAGLDARKISERFALAATTEAAAAAGNGRAPEHPISAMAHSKSHIDRVLKGQAAPSPPWPFTEVFLKITSRAARLTKEAHIERCEQAQALVKAMLKDSPTSQLARRTSHRDTAIPGDSPSGETFAALRLELDLERARHTETHLRFALRDAHFLLATLWNIIRALRDLISGHHALEARVYHSNGDPAELSRLRDETQQALAHKHTAQEEADRVTARLRQLEAAWEQAQTELRRISLQPEAADLTLPTSDPEMSPQPVLPQDLLAQSALDDIAAALSMARDLNAQEELAARALQSTVIDASSVNPDDEFTVLLAATRLTDAEHRRMALESLLRDWPDHADTRVVLLRLIRDVDSFVRRIAVVGLSRSGAGDDDARDALVRLVHEAPESPDGDETVRASAVQGLADGWPGDPQVQETLIRLTRDLDNRVRMTSTDGLAAWPGDARARDALVRIIDEDEDDDVRAHAVGALAEGWPGDVQVRDALVRVVDEDEAEAIRAEAVRALSRGWTGDRDVRGLFLRLTRDDDINIRFVAAFHLATLWSSDADIGQALVRLILDEEDESIRTSAEGGLREAWPYATAVRETLFRALRPDVWVGSCHETTNAAPLVVS
ncbi:HEAT repeat domain-containing protein [Streptomyces sp. NPDC001982]|uniref:HEAT repeat domain-containing protein n=1 Tax=Streptomyces sp. NPDC001982 TaxID=3154405 RepID=UPI003328E392